MTRINTIPPQQLSGPHLVAEYKEITRVFALSAKAHERGLPAIPEAYRMGAGHVTFFYDKLGYIERRFAQLRAEMLARGYRPTIQDPGDQWHRLIPATAWKMWNPTDRDQAVNMARLVERDPEHYTQQTEKAA